MTTRASGAMDREIVLQTAQRSQDADTGEAVIDWTQAPVRLFAQWLPAGTREAWQAQQRLETFVDGVFRIWDREPRPTPEGSRILFDGRTFDVKPYIEIGRRYQLEIPVVGRAS